VTFPRERSQAMPEPEPVSSAIRVVSRS
jgi:hypothetical protein